jgi:hydrogenase expression/formation protein HypE
VRAAAAGALDDPGISVVEGALAAAALGATALHDPTEGGLASGLHEVAAAAGVGIVVDRDAVAWFEPGLALCAAVGLDAWATLASGAAIATFPAPVASRAIAELAAAGHVVAELGVVTDGAGVLDTGGTPIPWPARDELARLTEEEWR